MAVGVGSVAGGVGGFVAGGCVGSVEGVGAGAGVGVVSGFVAGAVVGSAVGSVVGAVVATGEVSVVAAVVKSIVVSVVATAEDVGTVLSGMFASLTESVLGNVKSMRIVSAVSVIAFDLPLINFWTILCHLSIGIMINPIAVAAKLAKLGIAARAMIARKPNRIQSAIFLINFIVLPPVGSYLNSHRNISLILNVVL